MSSKKKKYTPATATAATPVAMALASASSTASVALGNHQKKSSIVEVASSEANRKANNLVSKFEGEFTVVEPNEAAIKEYLTNADWPVGLQDSLIKSVVKFPMRFFILDDSGSMLTNDGHRVVGGKAGRKLIQCTRWSELTEAMMFHAQLAEVGRAPSEFRLLNNAEPITVGRGDDGGKALELVMSVLEDNPAGQTPLCHHINEVVAKIKTMEPLLRKQKKQACVVIATDGESTDGNIADAMRPLQDLPVWVVVRLCTDEDAIVEYWNGVDGELELEMDVLDDFMGEAKEVFDANPWMTYGESVHRFREFGAAIKEMDLLDECALSSEQMRVVCSHLVASGAARDLPHPDEDWDSFINACKAGLAARGPTWNPLVQKQTPWLDIKRLGKEYNKSGGSSICTIS